MMIQYTLPTEKFNEMVEKKVIEDVEKVDVDEFSDIEVNVDFIYNTTSVWGVQWGRSTLFNDYVTVNDITALESESITKEVGDIYVSNVEIAQYLEVFDIPHEWALDAVDEWRNPEEEERELDEEEFWYFVDSIQVAWEISREEN